MLKKLKTMRLHVQKDLNSCKPFHFLDQIQLNRNTNRRSQKIYECNQQNLRKDLKIRTNKPK